MRIEIDPKAADDPESHQWLDRILPRIYDGWHVWDTTGQSNPDTLSATTWISTGGKRVKELFVASTSRNAWSTYGRSVRVTTVPTAADELTPQDAVRLAEEPLWILVENRFSDGAFVKRVVKELDQSLHKLWQRSTRPIRIDSVGGKGQMAREVTRRMQENPYRPRLVAIVDSDRTAPGAAPSAEAKRLQDTCNQYNLPCWVLAKREAENYLPRLLLSAQPNPGANHQQRMDAWDGLTDDQKNFFDMKNGLPATLSEAEQLLFGGLSADDRETLTSGFSRNVYRCWKICNGSAKKELIIRGQGDLEHGIELIRREV